MRFFHRFFLFLVAALIGSPSYLAASYYGTLVFTEHNHNLTWAWSSDTDPNLSGAVSFDIVPKPPPEGLGTERWDVGVYGFDLDDLGRPSFEYLRPEGLWHEPGLVDHYNEVIYDSRTSIRIYSDVYRAPDPNFLFYFDDGGILSYMFQGHVGGLSGSQAYFGVQFFDLGNTIATPEPSLLCLLAIGIAGLGIPLWKRKSQSSPN